MSLYAFESAPRKGLCHVLTAGCFVTAFLMLGISGIDGLAYPVLYQFTAFVLLTAGAYILVRYILKLYRYELMDSGIVDMNGIPKYDLVITEITGRRRRVVTRVSVRDIDTAICLHERRDKATVKSLTEDGQRLYRYINDPFERRGIYLTVPEENSVLMIPVDDGMLTHLGRFCKVTQKGENT